MKSRRLIVETLTSQEFATFGEVIEIDNRRRRVKCKTEVHVGEKLVATGEATFMVDKREA